MTTPIEKTAAVSPVGQGSVDVAIDTTGVATVTFAHPKANSLPSALLSKLSSTLDDLATEKQALAIILESAGNGSFCAGASFDELKTIDSDEAATEFFSGFARVILSLRRCPKLVLGKVQGKAVGGGVGIIAACDYVVALEAAAVRLSELEVGIGPFVIGPAVERKVGTAAFAALAVDCAWRNADWCKAHGLFTELATDWTQLQADCQARALAFAGRNSDAVAEVKAMLWRGTDDWASLLYERAAVSGRLLRDTRTKIPE